MSIVNFKDVEWRSDQSREFALYWQSLRKDGSLPFQSDLNPADVKPLLSGVNIYEMLEGGEMNCRLLGTGLATGFGFDFTNMNFLELWDKEDAVKLKAMMLHLLEQGRGFYADLNGVSESGLQIKASTIGLPALDNSGKANRFVCYTHERDAPPTRDAWQDKVVSIFSSRMCFVDFN